MASSYRLAAQNITTTTAEILVTEDFSPFNPASGVTVTLTNSGTTTQGTTDTNGVTTFTGLTPLTTYTASATNSGNITFTTLEDTTPKIATASQWKDLANRVNEAVKVGSVVSEPSSVAYVNTANIANNAVTNAKLADESVTAAKIDFSTLSGNYSTSEVNTGFTWLDGETIYKKTVQISSLPNATETGYPHGVSNLGTVVDIKGIHRSGSKAYDLSAPGIGGSQYGLQLSVDATNIYINVGSDRRSDSADITIYYTKSA